MILAILNNKGGVGKTTTAVHVAYALAKLGKKVLCVDMDGQANLLIHIFPRNDVYDIEAKQNGKPQAVISHPSGVDVLPLSYYEATSKQYAAAIRSQAANYDITLIDCPPALETRTMGALEAATCVLIPTELERLSYNGLVKLLQLCETRSLPILGIIGVKFQKKLAAHNFFLPEIKTSYRKYFIDAVVPFSAVFPSASAMNQIGYEWTKKNPALTAYDTIAKHVISYAEKAVQHG
jgi:chromosome partitioning protein